MKRAAVPVGRNDTRPLPDARLRRQSASLDSANRAAPPQLLSLVVLLVLLVSELLYVTIRFDTQHLERIPALWARLIGWGPFYLRLSVTVFVVALLVSGKDIWAGLRESGPHRFRPRLFALHVTSLVALIWISGVVMDRNFPTASRQGLSALAWATAAVATVVLWALSIYRAEIWIAIARRGQLGILGGLAAGSAALVTGFITQDFWKPLARATFQIVEWLLRPVYPNLISEPGTFVLGTPSFLVNIAPACSGYEGIGLILVFLGAYLWMFRAHLRFPRALLLLPLAAGAVWMLNAMRIAVLILIGASGWPDIALGGFHSQAGWLTFNAVALGFVAISLRGRYFMAPEAPAPRSEASSGTADPTLAYLAPFLTIVAVSMITGAFSGGFDWLYPVRVVAAAAALWAFRRSYGEMQWRVSPGAIGLGVVVFLMWLALMPADVHDKDAWPNALRNIPPAWAAAWLAIRVLGYVITVPLAEELVFRGFLPRRLMRTDFSALPVTTFSWLPVALASLLFGVMHGQFWISGTIAGALFALALYRGRALGDAVQAHATTNGLMAAYVFITGNWSAWS